MREESNKEGIQHLINIPKKLNIGDGTWAREQESENCMNYITRRFFLITKYVHIYKIAITITMLRVKVVKVIAKVKEMMINDDDDQ